MVEFGVTGGEIGARGMRAVLREQIDAVALDPEVRAEVAASLHDVPRSLIEIRRSRMLELGSAVTRPRQAVIITVEHVAGLRVLAAFREQRFDVEHMLIAHMCLQPFGRLRSEERRVGKECRSRGSRY